MFVFFSDNNAKLQELLDKQRKNEEDIKKVKYFCIFSLCKIKKK